jgi:hypothetical protein
MTTARDAALGFLDALRGVSSLRAQERLLNTADRDLAAVLFHLAEDERTEVYAAVGPAKGEGLRAELVRMRHVRLGPETVSRIASHLAEHLVADRPLGPASRFFKPVKRGD